MIELTVKTLDSQNHSFSVEDDITVAQFKEHIANVVNIPTDSQRLIYCGRVLQDAKKLQEYDVNGKVIHLVQRAPPSTNRRSRSPSQPANNATARSRVFQGPVYLGSMALPSGIMEAQGIVPPPPTQSLSGSRLNVARRMLKRADNILNNLEDPQGTRTRESPTEEPQDDVTPVFAAQVFVPNAGSDDALAAAVSAVENGILQDQASTIPIPPETNAEPPVTPMNVEQSQDSTETPETQPSSSTSTANEASSTQNSTTGRLPENTSSTIEMARLLDDLNRIQERLKPFIQRYHTFMAEDPVLEGEQGTRENIRQTQTIINRVSEIMHLLGHAYHSLSDVMVQVNAPPPRPLLCRPILIQHSAVLQAGIPIQVEAQINLTPDRRPSDNNTSADQNTGTATPDNTTGATTNTATTDVPPRPQPTITSQTIRPNVHEIRIDSFPIDIRNMARNQAVMSMVQHVHDLTRRQQTNNNSVPPPQPQEVPAPPANAETTPAPTATGGTPPTNPAPGGTQQSLTNQSQPNVVVMPSVFVNNMNPNMEFFMEVTPESITIDSLETTVVTSAAQADNVLRGTFGGAPPEFLQTILQAVAGQMMRGAVNTNQTGTTQSATNTSETPTTTTTTTSETSQEPSTQTTTPTTATAGSNVNSQARVNTQTHPTTATQTRSTARPHVHLAQHTMQGFDPFLPCNSHHIRRRRHGNNGAQPNGTATTGVNNAEAEFQNNNQPANTFYNILQGFLMAVGHHVGRLQRTERAAPQETANTNATAPPTAPTVTSTESNNAQSNPDPLPPFSALLGQTMDFTIPVSNLTGNARHAQGPTIAAVLQNFPDHSYVEGESIFTDLMMTLARGLTFGDIIALNTGQLYPLYRIRPTLRTFFRNRILQGECPTQPAIDRGAARLVEELQPMLEIMNTLPVRDDIDIVQSVTQLFRSRFPCIISLVMSRMTRSLSCLVDQCMLTVRHFCALIMHCSRSGISDVEEIFRSLITRYTVGISSDILEWTIGSSISQLRHFLNSLDVPEASIQPYIVRRSDTRPPEVPQTPIVPETEPEAMEVEEGPIVEIRSEPVSAPIPTPVPPADTTPEIDVEPLPNVVIGSEPWHAVTPGEWIPIITRDIQRQRRQINQQPFSDAYLSGMPSKRRKIVTSNKPQGNVSQIISESVIRAVSDANLTTSVPVEAVAQAASTDSSLHNAYRELLRSRVQASLRENPDFTPERFPNASTFFNVK